MGLSLDARQKLLTRIPLFSTLDASEVSAVAEVAHTRSFAFREEVVHKGQPGRQVFAIESGRLKVTATSSEGREIVFTILGPGDVFGEIALLHAGERSATVTALEPTEVLTLDRRDFLPFLEHHPKLAIKLLEHVAAEIRRISEQIEDTVFLSLPARLAKKLVSLSRAFGREEEGGVRIDLTLFQQDLGELVGTTRESINKQIRAWEHDGLLSMDRGRILIHKPDQLECLAQITLL